MRPSEPTLVAALARRMIPVALVGVLCLSVPGCGAGSPRARRDATIAAAVAAALLVPLEIASAVARARALQDRPTSAALKQPLQLKGATMCAGSTHYELYCATDETVCVYRTSFGREYLCQEADCSDGPPAELVRWCHGDSTEPPTQK